MQGSAGQKRVTTDYLKHYKLIIPPLKEQQKIAKVLTTADQEIEIQQQKIAYLKQEKKALMQQLLTGKRRVKVDE
ncbi:MAG: type I restriction enzyme S subunit [Alteromonadaceae bacterium]|jgi:type I restriction enzyme S subunit